MKSLLITSIATLALMTGSADVFAGHCGSNLNQFSYNNSYSNYGWNTGYRPTTSFNLGYGSYNSPYAYGNQYGYNNGFGLGYNTGYSNWNSGYQVVPHGNHTHIVPTRSTSWYGY